MKKILLALTLTFAVSALADGIIADKLAQINKASVSGQIDRLSQNEKYLITQNLDQVLSILNLSAPSQRPDRPDWRRHPNYERNKVISYSDDYCTRVITEFKPSDRCQSLGAIFGSSIVKAVSVNGNCTNSVDTYFRNSCDSMVDLAGAQRPRTADLEVFSDDYCTRKLTTIDPGVDCQSLGDVLNGTQARSVILDGKTCVNLIDRNFSAHTCLDYQDGVVSRYETDGTRRRGDAVELFSDDYCTRGVTTIRRGDNCSALSGIFGTLGIRSVNFRGQCVNITDTAFAYACDSYVR